VGRIKCKILFHLKAEVFIAFPESFVVFKGLFFPEDRGKTK
jgi:hypothetical protein